MLKVQLEFDVLEMIPVTRVLFKTRVWDTPLMYIFPRVCNNIRLELCEVNINLVILGIKKLRWVNFNDLLDIYVQCQGPQRILNKPRFSISDLRALKGL